MVTKANGWRRIAKLNELIKGRGYVEHDNIIIYTVKWKIIMVDDNGGYGKRSDNPPNLMMLFMHRFKFTAIKVSIPNPIR